MEVRIDLSVIAGNPAKTQEHPSKANHAEKQQNCNRVGQCCGGFRVLKNSAEAGEAPEDRKADWHSPKHEWSSVSMRVGRCSHLSRIGLARPETEPARMGAGSLLVEDGCSHDVRGSALVALVRVQLRYKCHSVVPDLATACNIGLSDRNFSPIRSNKATMPVGLRHGARLCDRQTHTDD